MSTQVDRRTISFEQPNLKTFNAGFGGLLETDRFSFEFGRNYSFDRFGASGDVELNLDAGLYPYLQLPSFGALALSYNIDSSLSLPGSISGDSGFTITSDSNYQVLPSSIIGSTLSLPKAGLDFRFDLGPLGLSDFQVGPFRALPDLIVPETSGAVTLLEVSVDTAAKKIASGFWGDIELTLPTNLTPDERNTLPIDNRVGVLGAISAFDDAPILEGTIDLEGLAIRFIPKLRPFEKVLAGKYPDEGTFLGAKVEWDLLTIDTGFSLGVGHTLEFAPSDVVVTMTGEDGVEITNAIGGDFQFLAPGQDALDDGVYNLDVRYDIVGTLTADFGPVGRWNGFDLAGPSVKAEFPGGSIDFTTLEVGLLKDAGILSTPFKSFSRPVEVGDIEPVTFTLQIPVGDGPVETERVTILDADGEQLGVLGLSAPIYMFDGDADFEVVISSADTGVQYNFAYIVDVSGSMRGFPLTQTKNAYNALTASLETQSIASVSEFAVIPFASGSQIFAPLTSSETTSRINSLQASGLTNFRAPLELAVDFFQDSPPGVSNVAFFLSDGFPNQGGDYSAAATALRQLADVRAFGIGSANLQTLQVIDPGARILTSPADLITEFASSRLRPDDIDSLEILRNGEIIEQVSANQLVDTPLGLRYNGSVDGLQVGATAVNTLTARLIFSDGTPTTEVDFTITGGSGSGSGTAGDDVIRMGARDTSVDLGAGDDRLTANNLDNVIDATQGNNIINAAGGNDRILLNDPSRFSNTVDGGPGIDTVVYPNARNAYNVRKVGEVVTIGDSTDRLVNVEFIEFSDLTINTEDLQSIPRVSVSTREVDEGAGRQAALDLSLSRAATSPITVDFRVLAGTARPGSDIEEEGGSITIPVGATSATVDITAIDNERVDGDKTFSIRLLNLEGAVFSDGSVRQDIDVILADDDSFAVVQLVPVVDELPEGEGDYVYRVERSGNTEIAIQVGFGVFGFGAAPAEADDFGGAFPAGTLNFAAGETSRTVRFRAVDDSIFEPDETFFVALGDIDPDRVLIDPAAGLAFGKILNNDTDPDRIDILAVSDVGFVIGPGPIEIDALANDFVDGTLTDFRLIELPSAGTARIVDQMIQFDPGADFGTLVELDPDTDGIRVEVERFRYSISDMFGNVSEAEVVVNVLQPKNRSPIAGDDAASAPFVTPVTIAVLANDTDPDGSLDPTSVTIITEPTLGTAEVNLDGTITYTPNPGESGEDRFTYTVADNEGAVSNEATVTVTIGSAEVPPPVDPEPEPVPVVDTLPALIEGKQVAESAINGVDRSQMVISASGNAAISFVDEYAAFQNSLGVYLVGPDDTIRDPQWVFERIEHAEPSDLASNLARPGGGPLSPGDTVLLSELFDPAELGTGVEFGLFLVADGAARNPFVVFDGGTLEFRTDDAVARVTDTTPELFHIAENGVERLVHGNIMHTVDAGSPNPLSNKLNPGNAGQAISGLLDGQFVVAFEDQPYRASDKDFNDALFAIDLLDDDTLDIAVVNADDRFASDVDTALPNATLPPELVATQVTAITETLVVESEMIT